MKKYLSIGVVLLFIGLAVAPSINANVSKEALVEFTTEVCGLNGGKQTVKLTQEEANEVEVLFDSIRERLNATESREEAEEIFKEAVVELDKYGLLGGLSVKQAQKLVIGKYQNPIVKRVIDRIYKRYPQMLDDDENRFCMIAGKVDTTMFKGILHIFGFKIYEILWLICQNINDSDLRDAMETLMTLPWLIPFIVITLHDELKLFAFGDKVYVGVKSGKYYPTEGWITTRSSTKEKSWSGKLWGNLPFKLFIIDQGIYKTTWYPGVWGFKGIRILDIETNEISLIGFTSWVKLTKEFPYP